MPPLNNRYQFLVDSLLVDLSRTPYEDKDICPSGIIGTYRGIPVRAVPGIRKVYFNNRHTTILWEDGVKTTVGCMEGQEFDEYSGFAAAVVKRLFGSSGTAFKYMNERKEVQPKPDAKTQTRGDKNAKTGQHQNRR